MKVVLAIAASVFSFGASAAEFYAVVDNFGRRPLNAFLDVAVDARSGGGVAPEVLFNVYDTIGSQLAEFIVTTRDGYASTISSGNLFAYASGGPILVRARTPNATNAGAVLHMDSRGAPMIVGVPSKFEGDGTLAGAGTLFSVPLGSFQKATLLIANVSGGDIGIDVYKGTDGGAGLGLYTNPRVQNHGTWRLELTQNEAFSNVVVGSTAPVVVQVVIDDGKTVQSHMVFPSS